LFPDLSPVHNLLPLRILLPIQTPNSQPNSVSFTTCATSYPGFPRACAAEPFPSSDYALLRALSIASVTEPTTRVKEHSHRQLLMAIRRSTGEDNVALSGQIILAR
jgi:hypothetical protein